LEASSSKNLNFELTWINKLGNEVENKKKDRKRSPAAVWEHCSCIVYIFMHFPVQLDIRIQIA
jgi:hypothetical protein